ncbi:MAG: hypothetical protein ACPHID_00890 [Thermoplasmatota archaeon]
MTLHAEATLAAGIVAIVTSGLAWRAVVKARRNMGLVVFWASSCAFAIAFTLLRVASLRDLGGLEAIFYLQTLAGVATATSLYYIVAQAVWARGRLGGEVASILSAVTLTLMWSEGIMGPYHTAGGVEFTPISRLAKALIAGGFVGAPSALACIMAWVLWRRGAGDAALRGTLFSAAVMLMFVPNALRYLLVPSATEGVVLAWCMAIGGGFGWLAYRIPRSPSPL